MKIKSRKEFLDNYKKNKKEIILNEALANDVNWGDSLLGRLINSIIRYSKINLIGLSKIDDLLKKLNAEFEKLSVIINVSDESMDLIKIVEYKQFFLEHIEEISQSIEKNTDVDELIKLVEIKKNRVELYKKDSTEQELIDLKIEFIGLLDDFLTYLNGTSNNRKIGPYFLTTDDNIGFLDNKKLNRNDPKVLAYFLNKSTFDFSGATYSNTLNFWSNAAPINSSKIDKNIDVDDQFLKADDLNSSPRFKGFKVPLCDKDPNFDKDFHDKRKKDILDEILKINKKNVTNKMLVIKKLFENENIDGTFYNNYKKGIYNYSEFLLENTPTTNPPPTTNSPNPILDEFNKIFEDFKPKLEIDEEELKNKIKESNEKSIPLDSVVEIVRLFNRAYRIHTPGVIPSGRTGGKVSNSVFREYDNLGDRDGSPDAPGAGPYRNIKLFDKWKSGVFDIIKNSKYQEIFNDDTKFKLGNADERRNISISGDAKDKKIKQGGGKTLLTFINDMLSNSNPYKKDSQSKFISEYFNVKLSDTDLNYFKNDISKNQSNADGDTKSEKLEFKLIKNYGYEKNNIIRIKENNDYWYIKILEKNSDRNYYMLVSKGNPFDLNIDGAKDIVPKNNLFIGKTDRDFIDSSFTFIDSGNIENGIKGSIELDIKNWDSSNPEILHKGIEVFKDESEIKDKDNKDKFNEVDLTKLPGFFN